MNDLYAEQKPISLCDLTKMKSGAIISSLKSTILNWEKVIGIPLGYHEGSFAGIKTLCIDETH